MMPPKSRILLLTCAFLHGCDRDLTTSENVSTSAARSEARLPSTPEIVELNPRARPPTAEERAIMQALIEIAQRDPHALLDVVTHGDPSSSISRDQAIVLLQLHCDDWRVLARLAHEVEGAGQMQMARQIASRLANSGDFDSAHSFIEAMNPGIARATALGAALMIQVVATGPDEVLDKLRDCEPDEAAIILKGFSTGTSRFYAANPDTGRPDLTRYQSIEGLPEIVAHSYVFANSTSRPYEVLEFVQEIENSEWKEHVVPLLDNWAHRIGSSARRTDAMLDDNLVEEVLLIGGATESRVVMDMLKEFGFEP